MEVRSRFQILSWSSSTNQNIMFPNPASAYFISVKILLYLQHHLLYLRTFEDGIYDVYHPSCTYCASQSQLFPLLFPFMDSCLSHLCSDRNQICLPWMDFSLILIRFVRLCVVAARRKGYFLNSRWLLHLYIITAAESRCPDQGKMSWYIFEQLF